MSLKLAASLGVMQTVVSMVLGFFSIKVTSTFLGPAGLGTIGQLTYFMSLVQGTLATGLQVGLTRRAAEIGVADSRYALLTSTVLRLVLMVGVPIAILIAAASPWIAVHLLHEEQLGKALRLYALVMLAGLIATMITGCALAAKDMRSVAIINTGSGVASFVLIAALCPYLGVTGGMIALAVLPVCTLGIAWVRSRGSQWWPNHPFSNGFSVKEARGMLAYVPVVAVNTIGSPVLQLSIRAKVEAAGSMSAVGLLQGVNRLSDVCVNVASAVIVMYFFPRFSEIRWPDEMWRELRKGVVLIAPVMILVGLAIYLLRDLIVHLLFTPAFYPMRELFGWQMLGNAVKMTGALFGYMLLSKVHAAAMGVLDFVTLLAWWGFASYLVPANGTVGAPQAYAATSALYAVITVTASILVLRRMTVRGKESPAT